MALWTALTANRRGLEFVRASRYNSSMRKPVPLIARQCGPLTGSARVPGDKSLSHRALIFGALAIGETIISGLLESEDVLDTATALQALGAHIERGDDGLWRVYGVGVGGLKEPENVLDLGNSGTSARLLMGLLATHPITAVMTGDASLRRRPMQRVIAPLRDMGASFYARGDGFLPLAVRGSADPLCIEYRLPVPSAQVKSAILLAALNTPGATTIIEPVPTRDHTENMLRHLGVQVDIEPLEEEGQSITLTGFQKIQPSSIDIAADPSSAAFATAAAVLVEGSEITLPRIGYGPRRNGFFLCLQEMGADITTSNQRLEAGELLADLHIRYDGALSGIDVPPERAPDMIDEFPILAVVAACAKGTTRLSGLAELRVKESDRLEMMAKGLAQCGVAVEMGPDSLTIHGTGQIPQGGVVIECAGDHRIAMSFLVLGCICEAPITVDDTRSVSTSFPEFQTFMNGFGANIAAADEALLLLDPAA